MSKILIKNGNVFYQNKIQKLDILIKNDLIINVEKDINDNDVEVIDAKNKLVSAGFVDMHTHLREPGFVYKETIKTGTSAALNGGFTHIVAMANTNPCMDNEKTVDWFEHKVKEDSVVNTYTYAAISENLKGGKLVDINNLSTKNIVIGFSDDGKGLQNDNLMYEAMLKVKENNSLLVAHCEDEKELKANACVHDGIYAKKHNLIGINNESEYLQVKRDIELVKKTNAKYHVCHVSTKESVEIIKEAKKLNLDVSCEVTPHHLVLNDSMIKDNVTNYKMNPPLRDVSDQESLIRGLNENIIEIIATDHAPHSEEEKNTTIEKAPFGIIGLEWAFPVLYTHLVKKNLVQLETILKAMTTNPSKRLGIDHELEINKKANIVIIDLAKEFILAKDNLVSKSKNSPFINEKCFGKIELVIVNGKINRIGDD